MKPTLCLSRSCRQKCNQRSPEIFSRSWERAASAATCRFSLRASMHECECMSDVVSQRAASFVTASPSGSWALPFRISFDPLKSRCPPYPWMIILKLLLTKSLGLSLGAVLSSCTGGLAGLSLENRKNWIESLSQRSKYWRKHGPSSSSRLMIWLTSFSRINVSAKNSFLTVTTLFMVDLLTHVNYFSFHHFHHTSLEVELSFLTFLRISPKSFLLSCCINFAIELRARIFCFCLSATRF